MESKQTLLARAGITPDIADLCEQVVRWRQTRRHRERMPEPLWTLAASLARQHTVARIARLVRLDYYALKERLESLVETGAKQEGRPAFVELPVSLCAPSAECTIEMEHPHGGRMRIQVKGATPDLAALSRGFWGRES